MSSKPWSKGCLSVVSPSLVDPLSGDRQGRTKLSHKSLGVGAIIWMILLFAALSIRAGSGQVLYEDAFVDVQQLLQRATLYGEKVGEPFWVPDPGDIQVSSGALLLDPRRADAHRTGFALQFDEVEEYRIQLTMAYPEFLATDAHFGLLFSGPTRDPSGEEYEEYRYIFVRPVDMLVYLVGKHDDLEVLELDRRLFPVGDELALDLIVRKEEHGLTGYLQFDGAIYTLKNALPLSNLTIYTQNVPAVFRNLKISALDPEMSATLDFHGFYESDQGDSKEKVSLNPVWTFAQVGEEFALVVDVVNNTSEPIEDLTVRVEAPSLSIEGEESRLISISERQSVTLSWRALGNEVGLHVVRFIVDSQSGFVSTDAAIETYPQGLRVPSGTRDTHFTNGILREDDYVVLANDLIRITFLRGISGYGAQLVEVKSEHGSWVRLGVLPYLGRLIAGHPDSELTFYADDVDLEDHSVTFYSMVTDGAGVSWVIQTRWKLDANDHTANVTYTVTPQEESALYFFEGPLLLAGEGTYGGQKEFALFPGLEFLQGDQESSSIKDFAEPWNWRYTPHPYKITVPLMSVTFKEGTVGLLWDAMAKWDGTHRHTGAAFSSPNRRMRPEVWSHRGENHLLGLFLPSVPDWVLENTGAATIPYQAEAGAPLTIDARLFASPSPDPMSALKAWIDEFGLPKPAPLPRTMQEELALSGYAYTDSMWVPERNGWHQVLEQDYVGQLASGPLLLHISSMLIENPELKDAFRERMMSLFPRSTPFERSAMDETATIYPLFLGGFDLFGLNELRSMVLRSMAAQRSDGSWRYVELPLPDIGKAWGSLGQDGMESIYHTTTNAFHVLRYASLTGDQRAEQSGLRALNYLMETPLKVPQGAPFEDPAVSPYLLSSSYAIDAFLEGFNLTGNRAYLEAAIDWAWKGLHFVYLWNIHDAPLQRYATIGVYGSSYYRVMSWIGQPVQWIGLYYARSLFRLSELDASFPWRTVAEGITVSGMYQQYDSGYNKGAFPDAVDGSGVILHAGFWDRRASIQPDLIMMNVLEMMGFPPKSHSVGVEIGGERVTAITPVPLAVEFRNNELIMTLDAPIEMPAFPLVVGIENPTDVSLDGVSIANERYLGWVVDDREDGWTYLERTKELSLRITLKAGQNTLRIKF